VASTWKWTLAAAGIAAAAAVVVPRVQWRADPPLRRVDVDFGEHGAIAEGVAENVLTHGPSAVLSPDGASLAFVGADGRLWTRRVDGGNATALAGTDGARDPFFSPDGAWIAFFTPKTLAKIPTAGGTVTPIMEIEAARGAWWGDHDTICYAGTRTAILRVSPAGEKLKPLTNLDLDDREVTQRWPQALDNGRLVLYTAHTKAGGFDEAFGVIQNLRTGRRKVVHRGGYFYRYLPSGHIVFILQSDLYAIPFDLGMLDVDGPPVKMLEGVTADPTSGGAQISLASDGTLLYMNGGRPGKLALSWLNRTGERQPLTPLLDYYYGVSLSPDGTRVAFGTTDGSHGTIAVLDPSSQRATVLASFQGATAPIWTPDGKRVTYSADGIVWHGVDSPGRVDKLTHSTNIQIPESWHPSGTVLAFREFTYLKRNDIKLLTVHGSDVTGWTFDDPKPLLASKDPTKEGEFGAAFSPDGHWIAYTSDATGQRKVYVRSFPALGDPWSVSPEGGMLPVWSRHGQQIFYRAKDGAMMAASWRVIDGRFETGAPVQWTSAASVDLDQVRGYDIDSSGHSSETRLAAITPPPLQTDRHLVLLSGFLGELRRRTKN